MKKVSVVGLGYIGLPTAVLAAQSGYIVYGYDVDEKKISCIAAGNSPIVEPDLDERLAHVLKRRSLRVSTTLKSADYIVVAVPTPFKNGKKADLSYVWAAGKTIAGVLKAGCTVILESTIPVRTTQSFSRLLEKHSGLKEGSDFFVAHCPERVLPGNVFHELVYNDRIIGGTCSKASRRAREFYLRFVKGELHICDDATAEMVKLVENSSRDVAIAFSNQVAAMAREAGVNPFDVIELANKHPRVSLLKPGCGVGGHCLAVDPWFLIEGFPAQSTLLKKSRMVNDSRPKEVVKDIENSIIKAKKRIKKQPTVLILGLTFKANIDDTRESPALFIAQRLKKKKDISLLVCEPYLSNDTILELGFEGVELDNGIARADVVAILVPHDFFRFIERKNVNKKEIVDTCGLLHDLDMLQRPTHFVAARTMNDNEKEASLKGIQKSRLSNNKKEKGKL
jgi:UDP-N-acetyl-D-mannosaminuronic acid dehydrogenase